MNEGMSKRLSLKSDTTHTSPEPEVKPRITPQYAESVLPTWFTEIYFAYLGRALV